MKNDIPTYSKGEEIFNGVTHIVGGGLGVVFLTVSLILEALHGGNALRLFALSVYGLSMIVLYVMSSLYHMIRPPRAKRVMRVFDHCSIFFLIAGTYAPLIILGVSDRKGYLLLGFVGLMAVLGITFNAIDLNGSRQNSLVRAVHRHGLVRHSDFSGIKGNAASGDDRSLVLRRSFLYGRFRLLCAGKAKEMVSFDLASLRSGREHSALHRDSFSSDLIFQKEIPDFIFLRTATKACVCRRRFAVSVRPDFPVRRLCRLAGRRFFLRRRPSASGGR